MVHEGVTNVGKKTDPFKYLFNVDFRKYITILSQQKAFLLVFCLSASLCSLALTYVFSEKYVAGAAIFYRPVETNVLRQQDTETFGAPAPHAPFKVIVQTLQHIVRSDAILRPVVKRLHLDEKVHVREPAWYKRWYRKTKDFLKDLAGKAWMILKYGRIIKDDPTVGAIATLSEDIDISTTKDSYVYALTVKHSSPVMAARIVDTTGEILVEWLTDQDKNPSEEKRIKLAQQLRDQEMAVEMLRRQLEQLLIKNKIASIPEETASSIKRLHATEQEVVQFEAEIKEQKTRITGLQAAIEKKAKDYVHPTDIKRMESDKLFAEVELEGLIAKRDYLLGSIKELQIRLDALPGLEKQMNDIQMKIDAGTREYNHLKDFYVEALGHATTVQPEIRVLHPAVIPARPVQPIKVYHVGLSALLSLVLAVGMVYVFAFFNIRIFFASKGIKARQTTAAPVSEVQS